MGRFSIDVDAKQLGEWAKKINQPNGMQREMFFDDCIKESAGRLLSLVIPRTPVGQSTKYQVKDEVMSTHGGTLRRGWSINNCEFEKSANRHMVNVINPVEYASYVEYGHRQTPGRFVPAIGKRLKRNWVKGQFFLQKSEKALESVLPKMIETKLNGYLKGTF